MAKEFDIYLRGRVFECDLMIHSLPYRDGLTVTNRMILESLIDAYTLQKFIAVQTGSELTSHIDEMLKTCYEMLNVGMSVNADTDFVAVYPNIPETNALEISADNINALANAFIEADNKIRLQLAPITASIAKCAGSGSNVIETEAELQNILKRSILSLNSSMAVNAADAETFAVKYLDVEAPVIPIAELVNLCYRVSIAMETAIGVSAIVAGTEIHIPFGRAHNAMEIDGVVTGESIQKFEVIQNTLNILAGLTESLIQFMTLGDAVVAVGFEADSIVKRHRLLGEMDNLSLDDFDNMIFDDLDYVVI